MENKNEVTTLQQYQAEARRTAHRSLDAYPEIIRRAYVELSTEEEGEELLKLQDVHIWAHGLTGEAGEVADLLKKVHGHGKPFDRAALVKELGDVLWYVANLADAHDVTLEEVAQTNVEKLRARYPKGFSVEAAAAKADEQPLVSKGPGSWVFPDFESPGPVTLPVVEPVAKIFELPILAAIPTFPEISYEEMVDFGPHFDGVELSLSMDPDEGGPF